MTIPYAQVKHLAILTLYLTFITPVTPSAIQEPKPSRDPFSMVVNSDCSSAVFNHTERLKSWKLLGTIGSGHRLEAWVVTDRQRWLALTPDTKLPRLQLRVLAVDPSAVELLPDLPARPACEPSPTRLTLSLLTHEESS